MELFIKAAFLMFFCRAVWAFCGLMAVCAEQAQDNSVENAFRLFALSLLNFSLASWGALAYFGAV